MRLVVTTRNERGRGGIPARRLALVLCALIAAWGLACTEANPLPSPWSEVQPGGSDNRHDDVWQGPPSPTGYEELAASLVYMSALSPQEAQGNVTLLGVSGAATGAIAVGVSVPEIDVDFTVPVGMDGSFATLLEGVYEDLEVELSYLASEGAGDGEPVVLAVRRLTGQETDVPWIYYGGEGDNGEPSGGWAPSDLDVDGMVEVSAPDANGVVTVQGVPGIVPTYTLIFVVHEPTGTSAVTQVLNNGSFNLRIHAATGDLLLLFAANPADPTLTTEDFELQVP